MIVVDVTRARPAGWTARLFALSQNRSFRRLALVQLRRWPATTQVQLAFDSSLISLSVVLDVTAYLSSAALDLSPDELATQLRMYLASRLGDHGDDNA